MHRFFCKEIGEPGNSVELDTRDQRHLFKTLRARPGDEVELANGRGTVAIARIDGNNTLLIKNREDFPPPAVKIHLFVSPPRRQKMDQLLRQCAETGVWKLVPILTARSVSQPEDSVLERWDAVLLEACKQAKNPYHPEVQPLQPFAKAVASCKNMDIYFGAPQGTWPPRRMPEAKPLSDIAWFVGPEGGFSPDEESALIAAGAQALRIGPWVMRVETAAICGAALLLCCIQKQKETE